MIHLSHFVKGIFSAFDDRPASFLMQPPIGISKIILSFQPYLPDSGVQIVEHLSLIQLSLSGKIVISAGKSAFGRNLYVENTFCSFYVLHLQII